MVFIIATINSKDSHSDEGFVVVVLFLYSSSEKQNLGCPRKYKEIYYKELTCVIVKHKKFEGLYNVPNTVVSIRRTVGKTLRKRCYVDKSPQIGKCRKHLLRIELVFFVVLIL